MNVVDVVQGSEAWLAARAGLVTASRMGDVTAKGKGSAESVTRANYRAQIIAERLTGAPSEDVFQSAAMQHGKEQEPFARAAYEASRGVLIDQVGLVLHPTIQGSGSSPDGLVGSDGGIEIKCPLTKTHIEYIIRGCVPSSYVDQMLWNMACTGRAWWDFVSFDNRLPEHLSLFVCRLERNESAISELEAAVLKFNEEVSDYISRLNRKVEAIG